MQRDNLIFYPTPGLDSRSNLFVERFLNILSEKYNVVGMEEISNDLKKMKRTKAFFINWGESACDWRFKRHLILYKLFGIKICWVFHNRVPHDCNDQKEIRNMKWLANFSDYIIILSHASIKYVPGAKKNEKKCVYLPHIHYVDAYPVSNLEIRDKYGIEKDKFVFSFLGALRPYKNIELVIQAFKELNLESARLLIAGNAKNGRYVNELRRLCHEDERIILDTGYISNGDMEGYLKGSDILVLPYNKVSSMNSGAMIMAFSYGRTVIAPKIAMAEDFEGENVAFIYDYMNENENYELLKDKMMEAYKCGPEGIRRIGETARRYVVENNNRDMVIQGLERMKI